MEISLGIAYDLLMSVMLLIKSLALRWQPIQFPLTNTLTRSLFYRMIGSNEVRSSTPKSSKISIRVLFGDPTDTNAIKDKFLTKPQA